jgi:hypothetical protein
MAASRLVLILTLAFLAAPLAAGAQPAGRIPRIGYLGTSSPSLEPHLVEAFRQSLRDLGYSEGQNITIEYRWAEGQDDRLPDLAAELVRLKADVIVTTGTPGTLAAKQATKTIPIVMASSGNPVESGLVASLARPGGNVTGLTIFGPETSSRGCSRGPCCHTAPCAQARRRRRRARARDSGSDRAGRAHRVCGDVRREACGESTGGRGARAGGEACQVMFLEPSDPGTHSEQ